MKTSKLLFILLLFTNFLISANLKISAFLGFGYVVVFKKYCKLKTSGEFINPFFNSVNEINMSPIPNADT
jgi:hypothetical protein